MKLVMTPALTPTLSPKKRVSIRTSPDTCSIPRCRLSFFVQSIELCDNFTFRIAK